MQHLCTLHRRQTLQNYCDTCRDAVCQTCVHLGPHADSRHKIMSLNQASRIRQMFYIAYRDKQVRPVLEQVYSYLSALGEKQLQVSRERKVIEKDIALEFEGITSRVDALVSRQIVKRQTQIKNYQQVLNRIEDLVYSFDGVVQFPQRFLLSYKQFHQQLKQLETMTLTIHKEAETVLSLKTVDLKAISTSWKVTPFEPSELQIPRQMALSFAKANQLDLYREKNRFLNKLIARSVEHYHQQVSRANKEVVHNKKRILRLYNNQNALLLQTQRAMICAYCSTAFSINQANQPCAYNKMFKSELNYKDVEIPSDIRGQKMHYWVPARHTQRPIPDLKAHFLIRNVQKKQYLSSLKDLKGILCKLKEYDIQKDEEKAFLKEFKKNDPENKGKVTPLAFMFIMTNKFDIEQIQVKVLSDICLDKENNMVDYLKVIEVIGNPLELYRQFQAQEEEMEKAKPQAPPSFRYRY